ncbi:MULTISPECIES: DUF6527 family protein [Roseobacteraceae]
MQVKLIKMLRWLRLLKTDFVVVQQEAFPNEGSISKGDLVVVRSGEVSKWACMRCPGGCGKQISLSLNPARRPRWGVSNDAWLRPTLAPSVHQKNECGCHFLLQNGKVRWCKNGRPRCQVGSLN